MRSREWSTYVALDYERGNTYTVLRQIAMSLGRIADMLTKKNGYPVEYNYEPMKEIGEDEAQQRGRFNI